MTDSRGSDSARRGTTSTTSKKKSTIEIPLRSFRRYVRGSGPPPPPITLVPPRDSTAYIVDQFVYPSATDSTDQTRRLLYYVVGFTDFPTVRFSIEAHKVLEYVSPRELEDWEYNQLLLKEQEEEERRKAQGELPKKKAGRPPVQNGPGQKKRHSGEGGGLHEARGSKLATPGPGSPPQLTASDEEALLLAKQAAGPSLSTPQKRKLDRFLDMENEDEEDEEEQEGDQEDDELEEEATSHLEEDGDEAAIMRQLQEDRGAESMVKGKGRSFSENMMDVDSDSVDQLTYPYPMDSSAGEYSSRGSSSAPAPLARPPPPQLSSSQPPSSSLPYPLSQPPSSSFSASGLPSSPSRTAAPPAPAPSTAAVTAPALPNAFSRMLHPAYAQRLAQQQQKKNVSAPKSSLDSYSQNDSLRPTNSLSPLSNAPQYVVDKIRAPMQSRQPQNGAAAYHNHQQTLLSFSTSLRPAPASASASRSPALPTPTTTTAKPTAPSSFTSANAATPRNGAGPSSSHSLPQPQPSTPTVSASVTLDSSRRKDKSSGSVVKKHKTPKQSEQPAPELPAGSEKAEGSASKRGKRKIKIVEPEWEVKDLLADEWVADEATGERVHKYLVLWEGDWPPDQNPTWEPEANVSKSLIKKYQKRIQTEQQSTQNQAQKQAKPKMHPQYTNMLKKRYSNVAEAFEGDIAGSAGLGGDGHDDDDDDDDDDERLFVTEDKQPPSGGGVPAFESFDDKLKQYHLIFPA
ncbi:hypothetical protein QBC46DRAFT_110501 [Diplogelasinospora grovesii]|uniref:Chromo domain-containing protein n=1 Tax=Diplogelasinospora grovesii TaxID=303347 RepID=A0AAN6N8I6_9PEZI|nr:hypothetical protein QBC46DRAFT_110501 [Diplogelasinospora grovesii]